MQSSRRKYIEAAYELLRDDVPQAISIRRVAQLARTSSAAIYRHFSSFDELVDVASFGFMRDYANDARVLSEVDLNPLELNLQLWECFAYYSFNRAPVFERLFFGRGAMGKVDGPASMYYREYLEELEGMPDFMCGMLTGSTLFDRERVLLNRARDIGMLSEDAVSYLCNANIYLYRGMLATACDDPRPRAARALMREFIQHLVRGYRSQLREGFTILAVELQDDSQSNPKGESASHVIQISVVTPEDRVSAVSRAV